MIKKTEAIVSQNSKEKPNNYEDIKSKPLINEIKQEEVKKLEVKE